MLLLARYKGIKFEYYANGDEVMPLLTFEIIEYKL